MKKKVLSIDTDDEVVEVAIRVPKFQNFGQRLGELELQSFRTKDPIDPEKFQASKDWMSALTKKYETKENPLEGVSGKQKKFVKDVLKRAMDMVHEAMNAAESPDEEDTDTLEDDGSFEYDLEQINVVLEEDVKWNKTSEGAVDQFLADWPKLRPGVLEAMFKYYKNLQAEVLAAHGNSESMKIRLPKPTSKEVVADLFCIETIYPHRDGTIGLSGSCTWDEEHDWGVLIKKGKVVKAGQADVAF